MIGANGSLTSYAGGIARKLWLLKHEGIAVKNSAKNEQLNIQHVSNSTFIIRFP
jgi:methylated-DNA-[protein]-cysteine S-methyltransferase